MNIDDMLEIWLKSKEQKAIKELDDMYMEDEKREADFLMKMMKGRESWIKETYGGPAGFLEHFSSANLIKKARLNRFAHPDEIQENKRKPELEDPTDIIPKKRREMIESERSMQATGSQNVINPEDFHETLSRKRELMIESEQNMQVTGSQNVINPEDFHETLSKKRKVQHQNHMDEQQESMEMMEQ